MSKKKPLKTVFVCQNQRDKDHPLGSCARKGSSDLLEHIKKICKQNPEWQIRATSSGCLGRCQEGPMCVIFPDNVWQTLQTKEEADAWLETNQRG